MFGITAPASMSSVNRSRSLERLVPGVTELTRLDASRRHPAGEAAARHGTAGRSREDHDTTELRA
jgi:hypothetical protein